MTYCDSSFLVALLIQGDRFAPEAGLLASGFSDALPLIPLAEVEVLTRLHRGLGDGTLTPQLHRSVIRQFEEDLSDGILVRKSPSPREHLAEALRLAQRYVPRMSVRTLDILHVAAALQMKYKHFASFDRRQRELASAAGLRLLPAKLS